jgi:hypothetical protein
MTEKASNETNQNIGELADDILSQLTLVEEALGDYERTEEIHVAKVEEVIDNLEEAQSDANEILRRFEDQVGPI